MKKIALTCILLLFFSIPVIGQQARSFEIMNPQVQPGDVVVIRIEPQWRGPIECLAAFGQHYSPNSYGYVFIGVPLGAKLGKEQVFRLECDRGVRLDSYVDEIIIREKTFPKTRGIRLGKPSEMPCRESQLQTVKDVYHPLSRSLPDLTEAMTYIDPTPLDRHREVIDYYGFIYSNNPVFPHCGVDLRLPVRTSIMAVNKGIVVLTGKFRAEGNMVILNHGLGIFSVYMHLSRVYVKNGQVVDKGRVIGLSGRAGVGVREPHLHLSIRIHDNYVDPLNFIDTVNRVLR